MPDGIGRRHGKVSGGILSIGIVLVAIGGVRAFRDDKKSGSPQWGGFFWKTIAISLLVIIVGIVLIGLPMVRNFDIAWEQILKEARPLSPWLGWAWLGGRQSSLLSWRLLCERWIADLPLWGGYWACGSYPDEGARGLAPVLWPGILDRAECAVAPSQPLVFADDDHSLVSGCRRGCPSFGKN